MRSAFVLLGLVLCVVISCQGASTSTYFSASDRANAKKILYEAIDTKDIPSLHFAVLGLKLLGEAIPKQVDVCKTLVDASSNGNPSTETLFFITTTYKAIGACSQPLPVINIVKVLNGVLASDSNIQELYYGIGGLVALNQKPQDVSKLVKSIQAIIKKNDSIVNLGYLFHIAANLGNDGTFAFDRIEDAIVQADEVDSKYLQFEGGLSITAVIVNGAYKLAQNLNKAPPISSDQSVKYANYFLSRKSVQTPKGVWSLLEALTTLTTNKFHLPVALTLVSSSAVSTETPNINIKISDVMGKTLGPMNVVADSATRASDNVVVLAKKKFESTTDSSVYSFNVMENKLEKGLYKLTMSATLAKADQRLQGSVGSTVPIKVMCSAAIEFVDVGTADADQTTQPKLERVQFPTKLGRVLEADTQQKVMMRFTVKDKTANKLISVHQLFVKMTMQVAGKGDHTVTFVAEHDSALQYKFDLDIGARAVDFNHMSGLYQIELLVGDAVLSNSFLWKVASVKLSFTGEPRKDQADSNLYKPKPVITHVFREPEVRPALFVSNLFSLLVCLPLLLLLVLWARLHINISNMPFSLPALGFHLGLGAIFGLFGLFWLQLNMFQTVKYLLGVGVVTFLCGNKLLHRLAHAKK